MVRALSLALLCTIQANMISSAAEYVPVHFTGAVEQEIYDLFEQSNIAGFAFRCGVLDLKYPEGIVSYAKRRAEESGVDGRVFTLLQGFSISQFSAAHPEMNDDSPGSAACEEIGQSSKLVEAKRTYERVTGAK